ACLAQLQPYGG
ncbi:hypothetical protein MKD33_19335, partial [Chromobacterium piscinae]